MPSPGSRFQWDLTTILLEVPSTPGVYSIWRDEVCVYVGDTKELAGPVSGVFS